MTFRPLKKKRVLKSNLEMLKRKTKAIGIYSSGNFWDISDEVLLFVIYLYILFVIYLYIFTQVGAVMSLFNVALLICDMICF